MQATVVVLTKLPDHLPVKTRLRPVLGEEGAKRLYLDMLARSVALGRRLDEEPTVAYSPPDVEADLPALKPCRFLPVPGADGATCLEHALALAWTGLPLIALGGDAPDLPGKRLDEVAAALAGGCDAVFVPTGDGGFSCLGLREPVDGLAAGFSYGGDDSLASLDAFLTARGLSTRHLEPWPDIDTPADLAAYEARNRS